MCALMAASSPSPTSTEMILDNTDVRQRMPVGVTIVFNQLMCSVSMKLHHSFVFSFSLKLTNAFYLLNNSMILIILPKIIKNNINVYKISMKKLIP